MGIRTLMEVRVQSTNEAESHYIMFCAWIQLSSMWQFVAVHSRDLTRWVLVCRMPVLLNAVMGKSFFEIFIPIMRLKCTSTEPLYYWPESKCRGSEAHFTWMQYENMVSLAPNQFCHLWHVLSCCLSMRAHNHRLPIILLLSTLTVASVWRDYRSRIGNVCSIMAQGSAVLCI